MSKKSIRDKLADPNYKGEDYEVDDRLNNGPILDRSCTDFLCCLIFLIFMGGFAVVAYYGFKNGDPKTLFAPLDSDGNFCGVTKGYEDYKLLYFQDITVLNWLPYEVCVSKCPNKGDKIDCKKTIKVQNCDDQKYRYDTINLFHKICLPKYETLPQQYQDAFNNVIGDIGIDDIGQSIQDIIHSWPIILISFATCFVATYIYTFLLRQFAEVLSWISLILGFAGIMALGYFSYKSAEDKYDDHSTTKSFLKIAAYVLWTIGALYILIILCIFNNIKIATAVLKTSSVFVSKNLHVVIVPYLSLAFTLLFIAAWAIIAAYLFSSGDIKASTNGTQYKHLVWDTTLRYFIIYEFFGLLWIAAMIISCTQYILTVVVCVWYFSSTSETRGKTSLRIGYRWLFRYNLGSIAFGSFLLALVWFLIVVFEYIQKKLEQSQKLASEPTACIKCVVSCCRCCLQCCHRFIKYLNKNAFVQVALHSTNFCRSAINGFLLAMKNRATFFVTEGLGGVFMFLGKVFISMLNTVIAFLIFKMWDDVNSKVNSPIAPMAAVYTVSYVISSLFMSIYAITSISLLQCFLTDVELTRKDKGDALEGKDGKHRPKELDALVQALTRKSL